MTNMDRMAVAALRALMDYRPETDNVTVHLEYSSIWHCPELRIHCFNDKGEVIKSEFYGDLYLGGIKNDETCVTGSFEEGFKRLEELIDGQK